MTDEKLTPAGIIEDYREVITGYRTLVKRLVAWMLVVTVCVVVALGLGAISLIQHGDEIHAVEQSRVQACTEQNTHHDTTVEALNAQIAALIAKTPPDKQAAVKAQLTASKAFTLALVQALQPHRDCASLPGGSTS